MIPAIRLKPVKERSLLNFHPWVFSGAVASHVKDIPEGSVVDVLSADGRFLARGHFHLGSIMVRVLSFIQEPIDEAFYLVRLQRALDARRVCGLPSASTNAFRLIHGEGDGLPGLIIDVYGDCAVIQTHTLAMSAAVPLIAGALQQLAGLPLQTIYSKSVEGAGKKNADAATSGHLKGQAVSGEVLENGHRFYVDWQSGQKTGFFLDQRENRQLLAGYSKGKQVLNTFCYSGGFSVYALAAGAAHVDSVDSSAKAIEWTDQNIGFVHSPAGTHASHVADVFDFLKTRGNHYDLIVLDPPAFAKRLHAVDQAVIGYRNLNFEAISRIKPGGVIFTFSCSQAVDTLLFRKTVFTAAAKARRPVRILHQLSQGPDHPVSLYHPEGEYLKGLVLQVE